METSYIPTYCQCAAKFYSLSNIEQQTISASLSATECWLYNIMIMPTRRDIIFVNNSIQCKSYADASSYLKCLPIYSQFFQCYTPISILLRLMLNEFKSNKDLQTQYEFTQDGINIARALYERCVGFKIGKSNLAIGFLRLFSENLLDINIPDNFDCPATLCAYEDKFSWELMEYPNNFIFHEVFVANMPESEKILLHDSIKNNPDPEQKIFWFHKEAWSLGINPVDALKNKNSEY